MRVANVLLSLGLILAAATSQTTRAASTTPLEPSSSQDTLTFLPDHPLLTFTYTTQTPNATNWIGVYPATVSSDGPAAHTNASANPSLVWTYAAASNATVRIHPASTALVPGRGYRAFLFAADGYEVLAEAGFIMTPGPGGVELGFLVAEVRLANARRGEGYEARVGGFVVVVPGDGEVRFGIVEGGDDGWIQVSDEGLVYGVPPLTGEENDTEIATATVEARSAKDASVARMRINIPIRPAAAPLVDRLGIMSFNLWQGGSQVEDYHAKQVRFLAASGADVAGLQEGSGGAARRLGEAMGWFWWAGEDGGSSSEDVGFVSRYPIVGARGVVGGEFAASVRVSLGYAGGEEEEDEGREVVVWNAHLGYTPYGPYDFCFGNMSVPEVLRREAESGRTAQMEEILAAMTADLETAAADDDKNGEVVGVFLVGDMNAPSHLDYTDDPASRAQHCGVGHVPWPTSLAPAEAGLVDSFRARHPDPVARPGVTWSPVVVENAGRPEPRDRIDCVYHAEASRVWVAEVGEVVVGEPRAVPGHWGNEWTSDHAAVLAVYGLE